jgi:hypothetical protein
MSLTAYLGRSEAEKGRVYNSPGLLPSASSLSFREDLFIGNLVNRGRVASLGDIRAEGEGFEPPRALS